MNGSRSNATRVANNIKGVGDEGSRRAEVLEIAAELIATSGLRTSMHDIARASDLKAGSLYHHFESKEALLVELLRRYHAELDGIAAKAIAELEVTSTRTGLDRITALCVAVAECAVAHRAAIQILMYETPSSSGELTKWTQRQPANLLEAMHQTLVSAQSHGYLRADIDLRNLADRFCQTMLRVGLDMMHNNAAPARVATLSCRVMLEGLATRIPSDSELNGSNAFRAADRVVRGWEDDPEPTDRISQIRQVARREFGRHGYEATTLRDIAAVVGVGHTRVFRLIGSKENLLASIMGAFGQKTDDGSVAVMRSESTPLEKIDALSWVYLNALHRFGDEFRIQLAWMRQVPPDASNPSVEFSARLKQTKRLVSQGIRDGAIQIDYSPREMLARCVMGLQWVPESILSRIGPADSQKHVRDTMLRGAAAINIRD